MSFVLDPNESSRILYPQIHYRYWVYLLRIFGSKWINFQYELAQRWRTGNLHFERKDTISASKMFVNKFN